MLPADVIVLEGILVLHMEEIRAMLNMKVRRAGSCRRARIQGTCTMHSVPISSCSPGSWYVVEG